MKLFGRTKVAEPVQYIPLVDAVRMCLESSGEQTIMSGSLKVSGRRGSCGIKFPDENLDFAIYSYSEIAAAFPGYKVTIDVIAKVQENTVSEMLSPGRRPWAAEYRQVRRYFKNPAKLQQWRQEEGRHAWIETVSLLLDK